ncbi:serpin-ZX [Tanacetum coccineum]|uniref:Serpin-ZX n=1 Tax=Tanacetum coccineum TaxID=301880 RepID=A0ABQ5J9Y9_9ASTR
MIESIFNHFVVGGVGALDVAIVLESPTIEGRRKKSKQIAFGDEPSIRLAKKQRKVTPIATLSANTTKVVTKTLLDDARHGFEKGNFVCSPLSLEIILGMLVAGAEGETLKQFVSWTSKP